MEKRDALESSIRATAMDIERATAWARNAAVAASQSMATLLKRMPGVDGAAERGLTPTDVNLIEAEIQSIEAHLAKLKSGLIGISKDHIRQAAHEFSLALENAEPPNFSYVAQVKIKYQVNEADRVKTSTRKVRISAPDLESAAHMAVANIHDLYKENEDYCASFEVSYTDLAGKQQEYMELAASWDRPENSKGDNPGPVLHR